MLTSLGKMVQRWTLAALETAFLLALSIPICIAAMIFASGPDKISSIVETLRPATDSHHSLAPAVRLLVGLSLSISTLKVRKTERNFCRSPMRMALAMHGNSVLMFSSIGTGATFSPPAVMINSFFRPERSVTNQQQSSMMQGAYSNI